jgi:hypothetical protein
MLDPGPSVITGDDNWLPVSFEIGFYDLVDTNDNDLGQFRTTYWKAGKVHSDVAKQTTENVAQYQALCQRTYSVCQCFL